MKAITTKFVPCTDTRGSRIRASEPDGRSVSIPYPHELGNEAAHRQAAQALCDRMGWTGRLIGGGVRGGTVWAFDDGDGWSANGCVANRYTVDVADDASDLAIARAVKAAAGWAGVGKRDEWAGADCGSWRDGTMGLSADLAE